MSYGQGIFKQRTQFLRRMSDAYIVNRNVWIKCSYIKARNDYIKTRDSITDSIIFHFDENEDVLAGDVVELNGTYYVLGNLVYDTFFELRMRKRSAGIETPFNCNIYSVSSERVENVGMTYSVEYKYNDVKYSAYRDVIDNRSVYDIPSDRKRIVISSIYDVSIGDGIEWEYGFYIIKDIDYKMDGVQSLEVEKENRDIQGKLL